MKHRLIPSEFIRRHSNLSWDAAQWGVEQHLAEKRLMVDLALDHLCRGSDTELEIRMAGLRHDEDWMINDLARRLATSGSSQSEAVKCRIWLYLLLFWIFDNKEDIADPLHEVELIFADFGYPSEIANFVRFMPVTDGYDPTKHSLADNEKRLMTNWKAYLLRSKIKLYDHRD